MIVCIVHGTVAFFFRCLFPSSSFSSSSLSLSLFFICRMFSRAFCRQVRLNSLNFKCNAIKCINPSDVGSFCLWIYCIYSCTLLRVSLLFYTMCLCVSVYISQREWVRETELPPPFIVISNLTLKIYTLHCLTEKDDFRRRFFQCLLVQCELFATMKIRYIRHSTHLLFVYIFTLPRLGVRFMLTIHSSTETRVYRKCRSQSKTNRQKGKLGRWTAPEFSELYR